MPQKIAPYVQAKYGWNYGESGWNIGMDENLLKFSYLFDKNVDSIVSTLPVATSTNSAYYLTSDNYIYFTVDGVYYSTPVPKWFQFYLRSTGASYIYDGSSVVNIVSPKDVSSNIARIDASTVINKNNIATVDNKVNTLTSNLKSAAYVDASGFLSISTYQDASSTVLTSGSVVGSVRNGKMSLTASSSSASFSADEVVVGVSIGGQQYRLANYSQNINLSVTGLGGMDTGSAPVSGFVAIYAIYNPSNKMQGIIATNCTSVKANEVYSGSNMPSGYTASALISVWKTNSSGQLLFGHQVDREVYFGFIIVLNTSTSTTTSTTIPLAGIIPINAKKTMLQIAATQSTAGSGVSITVTSTTNTIGGFGIQASASAGTSTHIGYGFCPIVTAQTLYYSMGTTNAGSYQIYVNGYTF